MNPRSLAQRIKRVEATVSGKRTVLRLESGETVYLTERAADLRLVMELIRAQHDAAETGEPVEIDDLERVRLFAQSVPDPAGGQVAHIAKQMAQEYLERDSQNG